MDPSNELKIEKKIYRQLLKGIVALQETGEHPDIDLLTDFLKYQQRDQLPVQELEQKIDVSLAQLEALNVISRDDQDVFHLESSLKNRVADATPSTSRGSQPSRPPISSKQGGQKRKLVSAGLRKSKAKRPRSGLFMASGSQQDSDDGSDIYYVSNSDDEYLDVSSDENEEPEQPKAQEVSNYNPEDFDNVSEPEKEAPATPAEVKTETKSSQEEPQPAEEEPAEVKPEKELAAEDEEQPSTSQN